MKRGNRRYLERNGGGIGGGPYAKLVGVLGGGIGTGSGGRVLGTGKKHREKAFSLTAPGDFLGGNFLLASSCRIIGEVYGFVGSKSDLIALKS